MSDFGPNPELEPRQAFESLAEQAIADTAYALGRTAWELAQSHDHLAALEQQRDLDPKTQLLTYPAFVQRVAPIVEGHRPSVRGDGLSMLLIDLDHFRRLNKVLGYQNADRQCLIPTAEIIQTTATRAGDASAGRFGGEEFVVVLDGTGRDGAVFVARSILRQINNIEYAGRSGRPRTLGASIGVTSITEPGIAYEAFFDQANQAVKAAKRQGRNRIRVYGEHTTLRPQALFGRLTKRPQ